MKTYYLTLSKVFPSTHENAGMNTYFEENLRVCKLHTIRANYDFWEKRFKQIAEGKACLSIRQWVGKPYGKGSTQQEIIRLSHEDGIGIQKLTFPSGTFNFAIIENAEHIAVVGDIAQTLAANDGLSLKDWESWFKDYDLSQPLAIIHFTSFRY